MQPRLSRRSLLKVLGTAPVSLSLAGCGSSDSPPAGAGAGFLTDEDKRTLNALANAILPPEPGSPGGSDMAPAAYVERLLTAFEVDPPAIFADGPFSGRAPLPDGKGGMTGAHPSNDFARFTPLDRVAEKAWRIKLYGSDAVDGGAINDPLVPKVVGLRDLVKKALADARSFAGAPVETLPQQQLLDTFDSLDKDVQYALVDLVTQAAFAAPEYGGNPNGIGWSLARFEGDVLPLGFSLFDETTGTYVDRPDYPLSTPDPGPDPAPIDPGTRDLLTQVVAFTGGKVLR